jgi:hypothetical protein
MATKTYHGSCRCKKIQFEADIDLTAGTGKCNCTYCWKARWWGVVLKPEAVRLLSGADELGYALRKDAEGKDGFGKERFVMRGLCKDCAVTPLGWGNIPEIGGDYVSVNVACLDDLDPTELVAAPVRYMDGLHDNWWNPPTETRHL